MIDAGTGRITPTQWRALLAAWLGWAFDGLDGYLYVMVAKKFVRQLLADGNSPEALAAVPASSVDEKAGIIQAAFLVGWALGGAIFGRLGDRFGRARTLTLTILTYAVFTGLACFATEWWHLLVFRFIAALGIGGEWAAGCSLVSETLPARHKTWASAALQSGYMVGCILAVLTSRWMSQFDPRWVFIVGVLPAFVVLWIRKAVPEPEGWAAAAREQKPPPMSALFGPGLAKTTLMLTALTSIALTTVWAFLFYMPQVAAAIPEVAAAEAARKGAAVEFAANVSIAFFVVNIVGNFAGTYLAKWLGYRASFTIMILGAMASFLIGFYNPATKGSVYWMACSAAFFSLGLFGMFPMYIPPLFPVLVRTLGAGFTYNAGRLFSGVGALCGAWITAHAGGPHKAIFRVGLLYIPGLIVALKCPLPPREETR